MKKKVIEENKKRKIGKIIAILSVIVISLVGFLIYYFGRDGGYSDKVPEGYIAVFHGGCCEVTYSTYIYKVDNDHANYGFKYINTTNSTVSWGSPQWTVKITKKGFVNWTDDVFTVAEKNGAYSYVTVPNDDKTYTIEEFMSRFLMN